jgi:hypothetical protein
MRNAALLLLLAAPLTAAGSGSDDVDALRWMSGCWAFETEETVVEEAWLGPRAGLMMGISRTVRAGRVIATERIEIAEDSSGVYYRASPSGQATATFRAARLSATEAVFENPAHDFPQRIAYRLGEDGAAMHARVESLDGARGFDIPYRRGPC